MNIRDIDCLQHATLAKLRPQVGGFNVSVAYYSVAKKGDCTPIGRANSCTWQGDAPSVAPVLPAGIPRVLEVVSHHGNGAWERACLYA